MAKKITYLLLAALFLALIFGGSVQASEVSSKWICDQTSVLKADISRNKEQLLASGIVQGAEEPNFLMSLWVNPATGSWTMLATVLADNSASCVVSFGTGFSVNRQQ